MQLKYSSTSDNKWWIIHRDLPLYGEARWNARQYSLKVLIHQKC